MVSPSAKRRGVRYLAREQGYSQRRGCALVKLARSSFRYLPPASGGRRSADRTDSEAGLGAQGLRLPEDHGLASAGGLKGECEESASGLEAGGATGASAEGEEPEDGAQGEVALRAERPNQVWTYDFLEDRTEDGKKLRILTVLDEYTRECLSITVDTSITADKVIMVLEWLFLTGGAGALKERQRAGVCGQSSAEVD